MIREIIRIGIDHSVVEVIMDRTIEEGCNMLIPIEMTLGEKTLDEHKIIEVKILEVDIEVIIEMTTLEEVGMTKVVAVGIDHV